MKAIGKHKLFLIWSLILGLTALQAGLWWTFTPPWAAPDEPGHYLYVRLYAASGRPPSPQDISATDWQALYASLRASHWQRTIHPHSAPTATIAQDETLQASGLQIGRKPPGYYALAAAWLHLLPHWQQQPLALQLRWLRGLSWLLRLLTTATILLLAQRLWPHQPERILGLGLLAGLLPMVGFIGGSVNNDALTLFWGSIAIAALILARSPGVWLLTALLILIGPLLIDISLLFLWPLAILRLIGFRWHRRGLQYAPLHTGRRPLLAAGFLLLVAAGLLLLPNPRWAAGWRWQNSARTRQDGQLYLAAASSGPARIVQTRSGKAILRRQGQRLTLSARVAGQSDASLFLQLSDGSHQVLTPCPVGPQPRICRSSLLLSPGSQHVSVSARLPQGQASLQLHLSDPDGQELLINGNGRWPAPLGAPLFTWLERHLPLPAGYFSRLFTPGVWDAPALLRYGLYIGFTWASFWGYFGWLSLPYPLSTYLFLALTTLAAGLGLGRYSLRQPRPSPDTGILCFTLLAAGLILLQTWLPMLGHAWQPQGRYLFPALPAILILLLIGWENLLSPRRRHWLPPLIFMILLLLNLQAWHIIRP